MRKTSEGLYAGANTPHGLSIGSRLGTTLNTAIHRPNPGPGELQQYHNTNDNKNNMVVSYSQGLSKCINNN